VICVLLVEGCRRDELLALRWSDLDFENKTLSIRRSGELIRTGVSFELPKSGKSRAIRLAGGMLDVLRKHRAAQNAERLLFGASY